MGLLVPVGTLRTWEDRYGQVVPVRNEGGRRLYSRRQVEQLRFVRARMSEGVSAADAHRLLAEREEAGEPLLPSPGSAPRLLIQLAESDIYAAEFAEYFLKTEGFDVEVTLTEAAAREAFAAARPAVVIVEVLISGGAGLELCRHFREHGGGLWPGSSTMIAGPSGSGKTIMGMHFVYGGARHGERGIIATLQENPTQLSRMLAGLDWPRAHPDVEVMYRSPVDIYIDEWVHDLLAAVETSQARRVVIDSLTDLQMAAVDDTRFREFTYSLAQRFSRQGITLLTTYETPGLLAVGPPPESAVSHLADNAIMLSHQRDHGAMTRSLAIIKTRASSHDPATRPFSISPDGITISDTAAPGRRG